MTPLDGISDFALWAILAGAAVAALTGGALAPWGLPALTGRPARAGVAPVAFLAVAALAAIVVAWVFRDVTWHDAARAFVVVVPCAWATGRALG